MILSLLACSSPMLFGQPANLPRQHEFWHDIAPRLQWNANSGYCGETSFISAGMYFGQYCSQFIARALASPGVNQTRPSSQLLLGVNDLFAAKKMRLQAVRFCDPTQTSTEQFLAWVKSETLAGNVVILGVFSNGIRLGEWSAQNQGDSEYDHIVPVLGFGSDFPFNKMHSSQYIGSDVLTISDNGLYGPFGKPAKYQFRYSFMLRHFSGTRSEANNPGGPIYMLNSRPPNFGIAIQGPLDLDGATIPVRLSSNKNSEPEMLRDSNIPPKPESIRLKVIVSIPEPDQEYHVYRYNDFHKVPISGFNAAADAAVEVWRIPKHSGKEFTFTVDALSNETVVFRAVPANAP